MRSTNPSVFRRTAAALLLGLLLAGCSRSDAPDDAADARLGEHVARLLPAAEVLAGANVPTLDPHTMADVEIEKVIGPAPHCTFRYTSTGDPVLGVTQAARGETAAAGVVKLDGDLVALEAVPAEGGIQLAADPIRLSLVADGDAAMAAPSQGEATLILEVGEDLRVGYRGYYACDE